MENLSGNFEPPAFEYFDIIAGPNSSSQMRIMNGEFYQKLTYSYYLKPVEIGQLTIESASIYSEDEVYFTDELSIHVMDQPVEPGRQSSSKVYSKSIKNQIVGPIDSLEQIKQKLKKLKTKKI